MAVIATIPQTNRQGTFVFSSFRIPQAINGEVLIRPNIANNDLRSTASVTMRFYFLDPVSSTWRHIASAKWQGPSDPANPDTLPTFSISIDQRLKDNDVRVEIEIPQQIRIGATVETV